MRKLVLCICLLWLLAPTLAAAESLTDSTGKLRGKVTDAATGAPIPSVLVQLLGTRIGASTDPSGSYMIIWIPAGEYTLRTKAIGWRQVQIDSVIVVSGQTTLLDFRMEPQSGTQAAAEGSRGGRVVIGRVVVAETGESISNVRISVPGTPLNATSDLNGNYILGNVPSGTFTLTAEGWGRRPAKRTGVFCTNRGVTFVDFSLEIDARFIARHTHSWWAWSDLRMSETQTMRTVYDYRSRPMLYTRLEDILRTQTGFVRR